MTLPVIAALWPVYFFWGTTCLAMKFAIEAFPPHIMLGICFMIAGALMFAWAWIRERPDVTWK